MNKVLFLVSHLGSSSSQLVEILNENERISMFDTGMSYSHPDNLDILFNKKHKISNTAAIYGDQLFYNYSLTSKNFYNICKFIYLIDNPKHTLYKLINNYNYTEKNALNYYSFRLRRICEIISENNNGILISIDGLQKATTLEIIDHYLELNQPLRIKENYTDEECNKLISYETLSKAEESYEHYFYFLKNSKISKLI